MYTCMQAMYTRFRVMRLCRVQDVYVYMHTCMHETLRCVHVYKEVCHGA